MTHIASGQLHVLINMNVTFLGKKRQKVAVALFSNIHAKSISDWSHNVQGDFAKHCRGLTQMCVHG